MAFAIFEQVDNKVQAVTETSSILMLQSTKYKTVVTNPLQACRALTPTKNL